MQQAPDNVDPSTFLLKRNEERDKGGVKGSLQEGDDTSVEVGVF